MGCIYVPPVKVQNLFLQRWRDTSWDEREEQDDKEFLEIEKEIYLKLFPNMTEPIKSEEEIEEETNNKGKETVEIDSSESDDESSKEA
mmetsp:Transcript_24073/g.50410  ORF Transcript_24073/g.50410 Transcript_24073/m.50410 type:complete len:88 (-) Transcript_24073:158-421(-)